MALADYNQDEPPPLEDCSRCLLKQEHLNGQSANVILILRVNQTAAEITHKGYNQDTTSLACISDDDSTFLRVIFSTQDAVELSNCQAFSVTNKPLRRGFLNVKSPSSAKAKLESVPFIKASKKAKNIPEYLKLDRKDDPQEQFKNEIKDLMKPTQDLVSEVLSNNEIQVGLEDPEIMMAVQDIASNPAAMHKYKHYPKVVNFYNNMGKLMGDSIQKQDKAKNKRHGSK